MNRSGIVLFSCWLVFGFVVWNVVFDRRVAVAGTAFTREQTLNRQEGRPLVSIEDGFGPLVRAAVLPATLWAGGLMSLGLALSLAAARRFPRPSSPAPPRPPGAGNSHTAMARRARRRPGAKAEAPPGWR